MKLSYFVKLHRFLNKNKALQFNNKDKGISLKQKKPGVDTATVRVHQAQISHVTALPPLLDPPP